MAKAKPETASARVRLSVRIDPSGVPLGMMCPTRRYRAGLGPFTIDPQVVEATPEQAEALRADPVLAVEAVE